MQAGEPKGDFHSIESRTRNNSLFKAKDHRSLLWEQSESRSDVITTAPGRFEQGVEVRLAQPVSDSYACSRSSRAAVSCNRRPILWNNRERPLFKTVEKFRFADDRAFDFRGDPESALEQRGRTLADSNERAGKGFVATYSFTRDYGGLVGRFKLDWFFVKPFVEDPRLKGQSHLFAPHFAETMRELNESAEDRISDHPPMTVDLPLREPAALPRQ